MFGCAGDGDGDLRGIARIDHASGDDDVDVNGDDVNHGACGGVCDYGNGDGIREYAEPDDDVYVECGVGTGLYDSGCSLFRNNSGRKYDDFAGNGDGGFSEFI